MYFNEKEYFKPDEKCNIENDCKDLPNIIKEIKHKKDANIEDRIIGEVKQSFKNEENKLNEEI